MSLVSIVQAEEMDLLSYKKAIEKSLNHLEFSFNKRFNKILVKPNLCYYYDYSTGETTDPKFVGILIDVLRDRFSQNLDISIVESDASAMRCRYVFKMLGYEKLAKDKDVRLVNLSKQKSKIVEIKINNKNLSLYIPEIINESDILINVPKIKYQFGTKITCALKNIYGCNAYQKKYVYHDYLDEAIVGLNKVIKSDLVIVDGIISTGILTKKLGMVISSEDTVAIDSVASKILGFNPKSIKHIVLASKEGLGKMQYKIIGEELSYIESIFPKKRMKNKIREFFSNIYLSYFR